MLSVFMKYPYILASLGASAKVVGKTLGGRQLAARLNTFAPAYSINLRLTVLFCSLRK